MFHMDALFFNFNCFNSSFNLLISSIFFCDWCSCLFIISSNNLIFSSNFSLSTQHFHISFIKIYSWYFYINLINSGTIKFYKRYVDGTLLLIKPSNIPTLLKMINNFDKNLNFTADTFPDGIVHFLDIKISADGTDIYRKATHTGQYTHFTSFEPFQRKTAWIRSLLDRAHKICSTKNLFDSQVKNIKSFMS